MVLFLFVVMMLDINLDKLREGFWEYLPMAGFIGVLMAAEMVMILAGKYFVSTEGITRVAVSSNTAEIGRIMYTDYFLPFELASVVLLVAIVAAITLTLRDRQESKSMDPSEQVKVRKQDRMRIVKMQSETEPVVEEASDDGEEA
jgi:NADH-quinone oxidoreductase subunit J